MGLKVTRHTVFCYEASKMVRLDLLILEDVCNRNEGLQKLPQ